MKGATILRTDNSGLHWADISISTSINPIDLNSVYFLDLQNGFSVGGVNGVTNGTLILDHNWWYNVEFTRDTFL